MAVIKAEQLTKTYKDGETVITALGGVTLSIERGEFVAITGRSGSGKSTLFHQLGLIDNPTSGSLTVNDTDALRLTEKQKTSFRLKNIGYIFQDYALIPTLTALENVVLPLLMAGVPRNEANAIATETLASVGLEGRGKHLPNELSGGQQQRVSIARAISHNPALILADEPTANLDNESSLKIMGIFKQLRDRGITVVMITHENEYAKMTDRIITLFDGKIEKEEKN